MQFYLLAIGARFEFHGKTYTKTGMSMTEDEQQHIGSIFHGGIEVSPSASRCSYPKRRQKNGSPSPGPLGSTI